MAVRRSRVRVAIERGLYIGGLLLTAACANLCTSDDEVPVSPEASEGQTRAEAPEDSIAGELVVETYAEGLTTPWALSFLPDGRILVTERPGALRVVGTDGVVSAPVEGVPEVFAQAQGGLLDVLVDGEWVYLCYAEPGNGGIAGTAVARGRWVDDALADTEVLFSQDPKTGGGNHFGCRLGMGPSGHLLIGVGERFDFMDNSQTLGNHHGKVLRIARDGSIPEDNPFVGTEGALPEIWSYGHRNIQGMAVHPETGAVYTHEHGPAGGDELNRPAAGQNYGWPLASYGNHYSGEDIPDAHASRGFAEPLYFWNPSIAPSGMTFYNGDLFPEWKGDLFVGALAHRHLAHLEMDGDTVVSEEKLLEDLGERIRAVEQGPDGALYVLVDNTDGRILRLGR